MTTPQLLIVCLTVGGVVGGGIYAALQLARQRATASRAHLAVLRHVGNQIEDCAALAERRAAGPSLVGETLLVHTRKPDDQSVRGVCVGHHADRLLLAEAVYYKPGGGTQDAQGVVEVPWLGVSTYQRIAAPEEG